MVIKMIFELKMCFLLISSNFTHNLLLIGDGFVNKSLCTFFTSKALLNKYWDNFEKNCLDRHDPFEKYINEIVARS